MAACPHTKVIALYIETIRRGRTFIETAQAVVPQKPVVAFYAGGSEAGKRASLSHTGAMAGPDKLYDGIFRQAGVIRAQSIEELYDFSWVLGQSPKPRGNRVIIQTHSGGPGVVTADACSREGLEIPSLSSETSEKLAPFIPHTGSVQNPVDLTFTKSLLDYFVHIPQILMEDAGSDGILTYYLFPFEKAAEFLNQKGASEEDILEKVQGLIDEQCQVVVDLIEKYQKPVVGYSFRNREDMLVRGLQDIGIPVLPSPTRAAKAMGALVKYVRFRDRLAKNELTGS
jgi:acyl-CoA synthetase (NDP forming)